MKILITSFLLFLSALSFCLDMSGDPIVGPIEKWSMFIDETEKICFIDFSTIDVHLEAVKVKSLKGELVFSEVVSDLPVDKIYELDYRALKKGSYTIHLLYYSGETSKLFSIN